MFNFNIVPPISHVLGPPPCLVGFLIGLDSLRGLSRGLHLCNACCSLVCCRCSETWTILSCEASSVPLPSQGRQTSAYSRPPRVLVVLEGLSYCRSWPPWRYHGRIEFCPFLLSPPTVTKPLFKSITPSDNPSSIYHNK